MIFDDGNRQIPEGAARAPERVVVVGAGPAGLTVANALRAAGVQEGDPVYIEKAELVWSDEL